MSIQKPKIIEPTSTTTTGSELQTNASPTISSYMSSKIFALSFFLKLIVITAHSSNLTYNIGNKSVRAKAAYNIFIQKLVSMGISRISVPLLFMISGYLFFLTIKSGSTQEFTDKFRKRFHTLVIPYFFWSLFGIVLFALLQSLPVSKPFFTKELIADFTPGKWLYTIFVLPIAAQLWFIRDLIVLIILSPVLFFCLKRIPKLLLLLIMLVWIFFMHIGPFSSDSLFFFTVGSYLAITKTPLESLPKIKNGYGLMALWIILLGIKTGLSMCQLTVWWPILLLHKFCILLGIVAAWYTYDTIYGNTDIRQKKYYSIFKYSFWIYVTHQPLIHIIKKALYKALGFSDGKSLIIFFLSVIITVSIIIPAGIILRKYFPKFYFMTTGGR